MEPIPEELKKEIPNLNDLLNICNIFMLGHKQDDSDHFSLAMNELRKSFQKSPLANYIILYTYINQIRTNPKKLEDHNQFEDLERFFNIGIQDNSKTGNYKRSIVRLNRQGTILKDKNKGYIVNQNIFNNFNKAREAVLRLSQ